MTQKNCITTCGEVVYRKASAAFRYRPVMVQISEEQVHQYAVTFNKRFKARQIA